MRWKANIGIKLFIALFGRRAGEICVNWKPEGLRSIEDAVLKARNNQLLVLVGYTNMERYAEVEPSAFPITAIIGNKGICD